ncbi:MAG TPA: hypothetical protein VF815_43490 [Myxococcaceae bacterium]|jgi:hypothetical protein
MSIRMLVLGAVVLGAAGQWACSTEAEAAQSRSTETSSAPAARPCEGEGRFCGGIANFQCAEGLQCVDDPSDSCDPDKSGADCSGICVCEDTGPEKP